jgi:arginase
MWTVVGAPLNSSARPGGEELGPGALRRAGLVERLGAADAGDIAGRVSPRERDPGTGVLGLPGLLAATAELDAAVGTVLAAGRCPLVLGGDCSLLLGVASALARHVERPGLWFVDGHTDTYPAAASPTGEAADMELAQITGGEHATLAPELVIVLGHRHPDDAEDASELEHVEPAVELIDARALRAAGPERVGRGAAQRLEREADGAWLHVDVDVLDAEALPAVSYPQPGGLEWDEFEALLAPLASSPSLLGLSVADLNPDLDPDGRYAARLSELLASVLPRNRDAAGGV